MTGGTFKLWLQEEYPTADLSFSSDTNTIANALQTAAQQLAALDVTVECYYFSVTKALLGGGKVLQLNITYLVDNSVAVLPLTATTVFTDDLTGECVICKIL